MTQKIKQYWRQATEDWNYIFKRELRNMIKDEGVLIFFFLVPLAYPLLYSFIYTGEVLREVPIAVVDDSRTPTSRDYIRRVDATADVHITDYCPDMEAAKQLIKHRDVYGIIYIPADFTDRLAKNKQVNVSIYSDMSGLLYYKAILTSNTNVSLALNARLKVMKAGNYTDREDAVTQQPIAYEEVSLYNPQNGFAAFLIPAVLILIIQQTLLLGVGIAAGTAREQNRFRELMPINRHYTGLMRIVLAKASAYLLVYIPLSVYVLGVIPRIFKLNQLANPADLAIFTIPFLLACIFFAMTVSVLVRHRETVILIIVFTSLPLLFISGVSWPASAVPSFWKALSYLFPSTMGINGFLKLNNMGGTLLEIRHEWDVLWIQGIFYFFTTCLVYRGSIISSRRRFVARYKRLKAERAQKDAQPE